MRCSVIITHVNQPVMLKTVISQIKRYSHPEVQHDIIVVDQSPQTIFEQIKREHTVSGTTIVHAPKIDPGYAINVGILHATGEFCCTLDCDAFPINKNWLLVPINLIQKNGFAVVGHSTGLDVSYKHKGDFLELNNYYRICRTSLAKKVAEDVGFMRPHAREVASFVPKNKDYEGTNLCPANMPPSYGDVGVVANWYIDNKKLGTKLALKMTKCLGVCKEYGGTYGMILDNLVFHLSLGYAEDYMSPESMLRLGEEFLKIKKLVNNGVNGDVIDKLVAQCSRDPGQPRIMSAIDGVWKKEYVPENLNKEIEVAISNS